MLKIEIDGAPVGLVAQRVQVVESDDPAWLPGDWAWMMVCVDPLVGEFPLPRGRSYSFWFEDIWLPATWEELRMRRSGKRIGLEIRVWTGA